jgi:hypothetical protein
MVTVPVRDEVAGFAATAMVTVPLPVPLAPLVTVNQEALLDAVHAHVLPAVTETLVVSPAAAADRLDGVMAGLQVTTPACVTVNVRPAIVTVPVRDEADVFAATVIATVPLPVPLAPPVTVSHAALLVAVQSQALPAVTDTEVFSPAAADDRLDGAMV